MHRLAPVLVIPALNPDYKLTDLVSDLQAENIQHTQFSHILIVNDGSDASAESLFAKLAERDGITVLNHSRNRGKGAALKTAFAWVLEHTSDECAGVVTADADGQHLPEDILKLCTQLNYAKGRLWLGCRQFDDKDIPFRSKLGNKLTLKLFRMATGQHVDDTQTGLRGIPRTYLPALIEIRFDGYEFELEMLLQAKQHKVRLATERITTVYEDANVRSHYRPLVDSYRIYRRFVRFALVGMSSAALDYGVFALSYWLSDNVLASIITARVTSGIVNFSINRQYVFQSSGKISHEIASYASLAGILILINYAFTEALHYLGITPYVGKPLAELLVFLMSYGGQRRFVFKS